MAEVRDVAPGLLKAITDDFNRRMAEDREIEYIVENGRAYVDAHHYADRVGEHLAEAFRNNISSGVLPDGKMYYNIAERTVRPAIENGRLLINGMSGMVQETLNEAAGIGLRAITPAPDTQRVDGIINRLTAEESFDDVAWLLDEPVKTLSRSFVDDYIKANADFHAKAGLSPRITRTSAGNCCEWCSHIAGSYEYDSPSVPRDIFKRHNRCRCMVLYDPADGSGYQDAHSKKWYDSEEAARIEQRKRVGLRENTPKRTRNKTTDSASEQRKDPQKVFEGSKAFSEKSREELYRSERILSGNKHETAVVYSKDGTKLFSKRGTENEVLFTAKETNKLRGCVLTHNHPHGGGFSADDIDTLRKTGLAEVRACTRQGTFVMRGTEDWPEALSSRAQIKKSLNEIYDQVGNEYREIAAQNGESILTHLLDVEIETNKRFAQKYGLEFVWENEKN